MIDATRNLQYNMYNKGHSYAMAVHITGLIQRHNNVSALRKRVAFKAKQCRVSLHGAMSFPRSRLLYLNKI